MPAKMTKATSAQKMPAKLRLKLANECEDLLSRAKISPTRRDQKFHLLNSKQINELTFNKMMILFESLMRDSYEKSSWGWNDEEKMSEFKHAKSKTILVTQNDGCDQNNRLLSGRVPDDDEDLVGFMNFRFAYGASKDECVVYVYELHVHPDFQRQGLGEELMRMSKIFASEFKMDKVMLTVFRSNEPGLKFYQKLNFIKDKSCPAINEADYMILSLKVK